MIPNFGIKLLKKICLGGTPNREKEEIPTIYLHQDIKYLTLQATSPKTSNLLWEAIIAFQVLMIFNLTSWLKGAPNNTKICRMADSMRVWRLLNCKWICNMALMNSLKNSAFATLKKLIKAIILSSWWSVSILVDLLKSGGGTKNLIF